MPKGAALSLRELLEARFGTRGFPNENPENLASIGVTAQRLLRGNPNRIAFLYINLSVDTHYLRFGAAPSATNGIQVGPGGGSVRVFYIDDFDLPAYEWNVLGAAAGGAFYCVEYVTA